MKNLLFVLLFIPLLSIGQNISKLEELNGFRELKLGSDIREYSFVEKANKTNTLYFYERRNSANIVIFKSMEFYGKTTTPETELYVVKKNTSNYKVMPAGDKIYKIFIETFNFKIYRIEIVVLAYSASDINLLKSYRDVFGLPTIDGYENYYDESLMYFDVWYGKNISLSIHQVKGYKIWQGKKRRFFKVTYTENGEISNFLDNMKKERDSIKKQKLIDDF